MCTVNYTNYLREPTFHHEFLFSFQLTFGCSVGCVCQTRQDIIARIAELTVDWLNPSTEPKVCWKDSVARKLWVAVTVTTTRRAQGPGGWPPNQQQEFFKPCPRSACSCNLGTVLKHVRSKCMAVSLPLYSGFPLEFLFSQVNVGHSYRHFSLLAMIYSIPIDCDKTKKL